MGLHLNYELRLPASETDAQVANRLGAWRAYAASLALSEVSPVMRAAAREHAPDSWWESAFAFYANVVAKPWDDDHPPLTGDVSTAQGFVVNPGRGCEMASFGLLRRADDAGDHQEWFWYCSCKTQYASIVSDAHLVTCHTSLVRLLDHAITMGIEVVVRDETGYWETRDAERLIAAVHEMNRVIAAFAGRLSDAIGDEHSVGAPIFGHPRFERIEMGEGEGEGEGE